MSHRRAPFSMLPFILILLIITAIACRAFLVNIQAFTREMKKHRDARHHNEVRKQAYRRYLEEMKARNKDVAEYSRDRWFPPV